MAVTIGRSKFHSRTWRRVTVGTFSLVCRVRRGSCLATFCAEVGHCYPNSFSSRSSLHHAFLTSYMKSVLTSRETTGLPKRQFCSECIAKMNLPMSTPCLHKRRVTEVRALCGRYNCSVWVGGYGVVVWSTHEAML